MKQHDRRANRLPHKALLPRGTVTVADVLARDDINAILANVATEKQKLTGIIVITLEAPNNTPCYYYSDLQRSDIVYALEQMKMDVLQGNDEDEQP